MMNISVELPTNKKFGFFFTVVFFVAAIYFLSIKSSMNSYFCAIISILFLLTTLLKPNALLPLNRIWMGIGTLLGKIVSPLVLGAIFFIIFAPMGLLLRALGRDELRLKLYYPKTHWVCRDQDNPRTRFEQQF